MITDKLTKNNIIVTSNKNKNKLIQNIRDNKKLLNIKFLSLEELRNNYYFTYNEKTIYYLMHKYHYKYDICVKYLDNIKYIDDITYQSDKLRKLVELKKELSCNNLLIYNNLFKEFLKDKQIIIYNYGLLNKYDTKFIEELKNNYNIIIYNEEKYRYTHKYIYEFNTLEEEVNFVAVKICSLITNGIDINNIKICGINNEYYNTIKRIFSFYNIPITINNTTIYSTKIGQDFLNNLNNDINITLEYLKDNYKDENSLTIYNKILNIVNKYIWVDNFIEIKDLLINEFKHSIINKPKLKNTISILDNLDYITDDDHIFLMSFNQGIIPINYKDEGYLNDKELNLLGLDTSNDLNKYVYKKWLNNINLTKNIYFSYKLSSQTGEFYLSSLNDDLNLEIKKWNINYNYSNIYNKIILTKNIDTLVKYNIEDASLPILYNSYPNIAYRTYNNNYSKIDKNNFDNYLDHKLILSYSAINNYYHCSFKYYLSNVLKLNIYEETFYTILGNLFHYILSICFDKDINLKEEYDNYIKKQTYKFNSSEIFFLNNLEDELIFIIDTIKEQYSYSKLNKTLYEERIEVDKSKDNYYIIFKGFVDKILLDDEESVASIIDYKTGNPDLNLNNSIYGLDLQLPVYIYLTKKKFPNIRIVGFYLQKILNTKINIDKKNNYIDLKKDKLKLQGYTNSDEQLINMFDNNYSNSKVIKGMRTSSKGISSKKILDDVKIDKLNDLVEDKIDEVIDKILNRDFDINPKRIAGDNIGCKYCTYKDICFKNESNIIDLKEYKNIEFLEEQQNN